MHKEFDFLRLQMSEPEVRTTTDAVDSVHVVTSADKTAEPTSIAIDTWWEDVIPIQVMPPLLRFCRASC